MLVAQDDQNMVHPAVPGALVGLLVGVVYEVSEPYFQDAYEIESLWQIVGEILLASVIGALCFAMAAKIMRRSKNNR
jgi:hypothetical protein